MSTFDPRATTSRLPTLTHADALELKRQSEADRREAQAWARREMLQYASMCSLGLLAALGVWKLIDLVLLGLRSTP